MVVVKTVTVKNGHQWLCFGAPTKSELAIGHGFSGRRGDIQIARGDSGSKLAVPLTKRACLVSKISGGKSRS